MLTVVLTTVAQPTAAARQWADLTPAPVHCLVVAGDAKGPASYPLRNTVFLGLDAQRKGTFRLAAILPTGHYCRKNVAYLEAIRRGATCVYETDDDNAPLPQWRPRQADVEVFREVSVGTFPVCGWVNVYRYFTDEMIWPRGFPLARIRDAVPEVSRVKTGADGAVTRSPIQQGLVNGSPDVDALWRLTQDRRLAFSDQVSVRLAPGAWCPFNSQSTWWWPAAYPLLYIPSHCTFRMCDIWRGLVAQRCLWAMGYGVVFHAPEVIQERNPHDYMQDFEAEIPGYRHNARIGSLLERLSLDGDPQAAGGNLRMCYEALISAGVLPGVEMGLVDAWLSDLRCVTGANA